MAIPKEEVARLTKSTTLYLIDRCLTRIDMFCPVLGSRGERGDKATGCDAGCKQCIFVIGVKKTKKQPLKVSL